jgi:hypothetical protein
MYTVSLDFEMIKVISNICCRCKYWNLVANHGLWLYLTQTKLQKLWPLADITASEISLNLLFLTKNYGLSLNLLYLHLNKNYEKENSNCHES